MNLIEAHTAPQEAVRAFPLPTRPTDRENRLLAGLERLETLRIEMTAKLVDLLDAREGDPDFEPNGDDEPSLGFSANNGHNGTDFSGGQDLEDEHDGREPDCEDEGAQCE